MKQAQAMWNGLVACNFLLTPLSLPLFLIWVCLFFKDCSLATRRREESGLTDLGRLFALIEKEGSLYAYVLHAGSITFFYLNAVL